MKPYSKEVLAEILLEGGATVLEEYTKTSQRLVVKYRCSCGVKAQKRFEMLKLYRLPYCEGCSLKKKEERKQATNLEKYGVTNSAAHPDIKNKIKQSCLEKYGDHPKRTAEVHQKWVNTCLEKYGGHPNQNREVQAKSEFKGCNYKDFTFPSGRIVKVQGYEDLALNNLLQNGVKESAIVIGKANVPVVDYWLNSKKHRYFPDIYLPAENKLIEVKSEWTYKYPTHREEKAEASVAEGYAYEIWVFSGNKTFIRREVYGFDGGKEVFDT
jgi:hypothetical protein